MIPETRYAVAPDGTHLAYDVVGDGPVDLLWIHGFMGGLETMFEHPVIQEQARSLATFARLITHDRRATGLSDRAAQIPDLETQVGDILAVLDEVGSHRTVIVGAGEGGFPAILFAATHPERTRALVLWLAQARTVRTDGYPWGYAPDEVERDIAAAATRWGQESYAAAVMAENAPSLVDDRAFVRWYAKVMRHWVAPGSAVAFLHRYFETDVREILPSIRVPTMVLSRDDGPADDRAEEEYVAERIPGATIARVPGADYASFVSTDAIADAIRGFVGVDKRPDTGGRVLVTTLFTDLVGSTERAAALGDAGWTALVGEHDAAVRSEIERHGGRFIDGAGDGVFATFPGPAHAVRCARAIGRSLAELGLRVRAGCHTGEVELDGDRVRGIAVVIGARVMQRAGPSEVLVTSTVKDLVAGSGLVFEDAGEHELKGVPDRWRLYRVVDAERP